MTSHSLWFLIPILSAGCQLEGDASPRPTAASSIEAVQARMHERFGAAQRIESAIVHSDLDRARKEARVIVQLDEPEALVRWRPYLAQVGVAGRDVEQAGDLVVAAKATATLGRQCARCHEAMAVKIAFPREARPTEDVKLVSQMAGHQWAAARMWEGLIGPASDRWLEGAKVLKQAPLTIVAQASAKELGDPSDSNNLQDDVARARLFATRALEARDQDARAEIFGQLLATCAHCHSMIRDR